MTSKRKLWFRPGRVLLALLAAMLMGTLLLGAPGVSAAARRDHSAGKIACVQLRAGGNNLEESLASLVEDGTISADQQTAILAELQSDKGAAAQLCSGMDFVRDHAVGEAVSELLGLDRAEIKIEWLSGQSLAEMAEAQGVERQALVDTITAAIETKLDQAVEKGRITEERKAEIVAELPAKIEEAIDLHLSDVVDRMRERHDDATSAPATPVTTTGAITAA